MRYLKFRIWLEEEKKMVHVSYSALYEDNVSYTLEFKSERDHDKEWKEGIITDSKTMQFTGLQDKNGKDIYEGDIIKLDKGYEDIIGSERTNCLVGFKDGAFMFGRGKDARLLNTYLWLVVANKNCEIIGNIYENPKLLEAK